MLLSLNLQRAGYEVLKAEDGRTGVKTREGRIPCSGGVLDLMMPGLSGLEAAKQLKAQPATARIPILMLTAKSDEVDRIVGLELGADDYVTKPFSPREIVLRVQSVLRRSEPVSVTSDELEVGPVKVEESGTRF